MDEEGRLILDVGRPIQLGELRQFRTYDGLMEGLPTTESNKKHIAFLLSGTKPAVLIEPVERLIDMGGERYPFGTPARLPAVTCIGRFHSRSIGENDPLYFSKLFVIWFQEKFTTPCPSAISNEIAAIDWDTHAENVEI